MWRKLIILTLIDIIVIISWYYWANNISTEPMEAMGVILLVPAIIIISGIAGLFLQCRNNLWGEPMLINTVIAFAIFFGAFKYAG
jgi:hypothetical protein